MEKLGFLVIGLVRNQKMDKFIDDFHQYNVTPKKDCGQGRSERGWQASLKADALKLVSPLTNRCWLVAAVSGRLGENIPQVFTTHGPV